MKESKAEREDRLLAAAPDCSWCGGACWPIVYRNRRDEPFCSPSHRSSSNRALKRLLGGRGRRNAAVELERSLRQLGLPASYALTTETFDHGGFSVVIREIVKGPHSSAGYFRASDASGDYGWRVGARPECAETLSQVKLIEPRIRSFWLVRGVALYDKKLQGRGFATAIYKVMLDEASRHGAVIGPHDCFKLGSTSSDAKRVWNRIGGKAHGPWRWNPALLP